MKKFKRIYLIVTILLIPILLISTLFMYNMILRNKIKTMAEEYLSEKYNNTFTIESIYYGFEGDDYHVVVHDENDVYFKLWYSKGREINEEKVYFMKLLSKEISTDISARSTELCGVYVNCYVYGEVDHFQKDVENRLYNDYKTLGYLPSAYELKDEDFYYVCRISFPEEYLKRDDTKINEVYDYIFNNWNVKYLICYKNSFDSENIIDTQDVKDRHNISIK